MLVVLNDIIKDIEKLPSKTAENIISFSLLPDGWDYGEGGPIPQLTINNALAWERFFDLKGWDTNAGPGTDGEIAVSAKLGSSRVEVVIEPKNTLTVAYDFKGTRVSYAPRISTQEAHKRILEIVEPWNASDSSTQRNSTENQISGLTSRLGIHDRTDRYRFLTMNVSNLPEERPVLIFRNIGRWSPVLWESQSYSGSSTR
jgi:hypothetical protein